LKSNHLPTMETGMVGTAKQTTAPKWRTRINWMVMATESAMPATTVRTPLIPIRRIATATASGTHLMLSPTILVGAIRHACRERAERVAAARLERR